MSRFDIRYTEIDDMMWECKDEMDSLIKSCEKYEDYINGFSQLSSFRGEAAEAIKAYMLDVHRSIISSIKTAANEFNDRFLIYKTGYYEIDNSCCYALPEEVLNQAITLYNNKLGDVIYESQRLKNALSNISGIYAIETPSTFSIENEHNELNDKLNKLIESIKDYESETKTQSLTNLEKLLGALKTSLSKCSAQTSESVTEYTAGSFFTEEHTIDLANNVYVCYTFHSQNEQQLEAAWDNEAEIREELERQREIQGFWQIVGGAFLIVTGTLCIVCTLGAATPIVVTGMVAGGGTILFGASDMLEGGQNIYYGANGDLSSTAFNPLRDTVFMGNQEIYDNTKNVFAFTAGAMCPISKAYGELGKLSFRTVGTIVGQEIISDQAGNLANMAVTEIGEQWNWNPYFTQTLAMGTGIFASNKTSNTLVGLDQKFNFSGNYPNIKVVENRNISGFKYKHNPSDNPKVLQDAIEDPSAVYGYRPREDGSLASFANGEWNNTIAVEGYRQDRIAYHNRNEGAAQRFISNMFLNGSTTEEVAKAVNQYRNQSRINSFIDTDGNIKNMDGYKAALVRAEKNSYENLIKRGKTPEQIIKSATKGNPAMDACTGLYDVYYDTY